MQFNYRLASGDLVNKLADHNTMDMTVMPILHICYFRAAGVIVSSNGSSFLNTLIFSGCPIFAASSA